eukprot:3751245-Amphidinium_carterae.1
MQCAGFARPLVNRRTSYTVAAHTEVEMMLGPWQCRKHPNGKWTSRAFPTVTCWEGSQRCACMCVPVCGIAVAIRHASGHQQ